MSKLTDSKLPLKGKSGTPHEFSIYTTDHEFRENSGGVYAFSKREKSGDNINHTILYVGKAIKFNQRLDNHEKWKDAVKLGANCICALSVEKESNMLAIEEDLIKGLSPKLNIVHKD